MVTTTKQAAAPTLLAEADAARYLTVSVGALRAWRGAGSGPAYLKIGAAVRYRPSDLDRYLESAKCEPEN